VLDGVTEADFGEDVADDDEFDDSIAASARSAVDDEDAVVDDVPVLIAPEAEGAAGLYGLVRIRTRLCTTPSHHCTGALLTGAYISIHYILRHTSHVIALHVLDCTHVQHYTSIALQLHMCCVFVCAFMSTVMCRSCWC
jgi:hypothetical protein